MIDFYFDFISPFGYFASLRIEHLAARHGLAVRWHPILIGVTVMKVMGLPPIFDIPLKGDYIKRELMRYSAMFEVELTRDPFAPPATALLASRAMALLTCASSKLASTFAHQAYRAYWQQVLDLNKPEVVRTVAERSGIDAELIQRCLGDEGKAALHQAMDAATARGVFGSPFIIVDEEPFFGVDKIELLDLWLKRRAENGSANL